MFLFINVLNTQFSVIVVINMTDIEENGEDSDTCTDKELASLFTNTCPLINQQQVASDNRYILHISSTSGQDFNVAVGLSTSTYSIYRFSNDNLANTNSIKLSKETTTGVKFSAFNDNIVYAGTSSKVGCWDLRSNEMVSQFIDTSSNSDGKAKVINSFDISANERVLAAGTDLLSSDSFILFWDMRAKKIMGGYWETHTNDITQIRFHPENSDKMASAAMDGLINIYDLLQTTEDDALVESLNTESSVEQLLWHGSDDICAVTHMSDVQIWKTDGVEPYVHYRRSELVKEIKRKSDKFTYVTAIQNCSKDNLLILCGSNHHNGKCLRCLRSANKKLLPLFDFKENNQIVRTSCYNQQAKVLLTGGEKGVLTAWRLQTI